MLDTPDIIIVCLATSSLDFNEIITRYDFILEENIFLILQFTILWLYTWIHNLPFWGHSIFTLTEFWTFLTTYLPLVNKHRKWKKGYLTYNSKHLTDHLPTSICLRKYRIAPLVKGSKSEFCRSGVCFWHYFQVSVLHALTKNCVLRQFFHFLSRITVNIHIVPSILTG